MIYDIKNNDKTKNDKTGFCYRIKYKKFGPLKYISHLDLNVLFRRTLRRTNMPLELTKGYNHRIKVSFGPALPLGIEGLEELLEIFLLEEIDTEKIKMKINKVSPNGLSVLEAKKISSANIRLSKSLQQAVYLIYMKPDCICDKFKLDELREEIPLNINKFLNQKNIMIVKKSKKGQKDVDLRPYIEDMVFCNTNKEFILIRLTINIQYHGSINPFLIAGEFLRKMANQRIQIEEIVRKKFILTDETECI